MSLSASLGRDKAAMAVDQALTRGLTTLALIDRHLHLTARRGRDGCRRLRDIAKDRLTLTEFPNTPLETLVFEMIVNEGLPLPELQMKIHDQSGRFIARPDFVYPDERLIVEGHSRLWHDGFEISRKDRWKERMLERLGYRIVYATWVDVTRNRRATASLIRMMLEDVTIGAPQGSPERRNRGNLG
jgi:very-short-patch-repair endonuclease